MRPSIVCHLGLHKTATSTLQEQFFPACQGLNLLTTLDPTVRQFIHGVTRKDPLYFNTSESRVLIESTLSNDSVNLISNESLSGPPFAGVVEWGLDHRSPVLRNLSAVFPDARIIIVLRRQDSLSRSHYRQYIKSGGTERIRRFYGLDRSDRPPIMSLDRFRFSPYLRLLAECFGSRVLALPFEQFVQDQDEFLRRVCEYLGVPKPNVPLSRENATRLGPLGIDVTRRLNFAMRSLVNRGLVPGLPFRRNGRWAQVSIVELIHDHWPGRPPRDKDSNLARTGEEILTMFRGDNLELDKEWNLGLKEYGYY